MVMQHRITTVDNPFDPFTEFEDWFACDTRLGHHSSSVLARVMVSSDELSAPDRARATEEAIDEIIRQDLFGVYAKVSREV